MLTEIKEFTSFAKTQLAPILGESGKVIYSSRDTISKGEIYLLGINPGGETDAVGNTTIRESLADLPKKISNDYLDETWSLPTMQARVADFLESLGKPVREVCASNVVFVRTQRAPSTRDFNAYADICWPVHSKVIGIVKPEVVIVFGSIAYDFLWYRAGKPTQTVGDSGHSNASCKSFEYSYSGHGVVVAGIPHFSWFPARPETIHFVKKCLEV